jgi:hypothetical protein
MDVSDQTYGSSEYMASDVFKAAIYILCKTKTSTFSNNLRICRVYLSNGSAWMFFKRFMDVSDQTYGSSEYMASEVFKAAIHI